MIKKFLMERDAGEIYHSLSEENKIKYMNIINKIVSKPENYIVSIDLARPYSKDFSVVMHSLYKEDGTIEIKGIDKF